MRNDSSSAHRCVGAGTDIVIRLKFKGARLSARPKRGNDEAQWIVVLAGWIRAGRPLISDQVAGPHVGAGGPVLGADQACRDLQAAFQSWGMLVFFSLGQSFQDRSIRLLLFRGVE